MAAGAQPFPDDRDLVVFAQVVHHHDYDLGVVHWWWWLLGLVVLALLVIALVLLLRERPVPSEHPKV